MCMWVFKRLAFNCSILDPNRSCFSFFPPSRKSRCLNKCNELNNRAECWSVRAATHPLMCMQLKRVQRTKGQGPLSVVTNTWKIHIQSVSVSTVLLHIAMITSSNQFGAKRNGCSWWEFVWRRWGEYLLSSSSSALEALTWRKNETKCSVLCIFNLVKLK